MAAINVRNRTIFHGDNLLFLRGINSGAVHLIATDPPFKKGRDFHAAPGSLAHGASFKDRWSWEKDVQGDWVLDPFCGCATTPIAAERLGRRWIGMDIWDEAHDIVLRRLADNGLAVPDLANKAGQPHLMTFGDVAYSTIPPERTDDNEIAAPQIKRKIRAPQEAWEKWTHKQMRQLLARCQTAPNDDRLVTCAGCGRELEQEFMELDHIMPKSAGGANHIANRILICRPCNDVKHNGLTLTGLRRANIQKGWMKDLRKADWAKAQQIEAVARAKLFPKEV